MAQIACHAKELLLAKQPKMFGPQHQAQPAGQFRVKSDDIHFGIVAHAFIVQVCRADSSPEIIDNSDLGMDIDRAVMFAILFAS